MTATLPVHHLGIGEIIVSPEPIVISTVLGSCVSVCLFSPGARMGGMIHFANATGPAGDYRYGDSAVPALVEALERLTGKTGFQAKLVGGAHEIGGARSQYEIGRANVQLARDLLAKQGIPIIGEDVGGDAGRKVLFETATGRVRVARVGAPNRRRVLIVDDSRTIQTLLRRILGEDPELEVVGVAGDANEAAALLPRLKPDVLTLDVHMPGLTGVQWLEKLLPVNPLPVVMITSMQLQEGNEVFRALELGAIDYVQKPSMGELSEAGRRIREVVKAASRARVVTLGARTAAPVAGRWDANRILAIGASTGGTEAIRAVLTALPAEIPPTVIVQHIPPVFSRAYAERIDKLCPFDVKEAEDGDELRRSRVLIAPGGKQMKVERMGTKSIVRITDDAPVNRHKPSVNYLFRSLEPFARDVTGVILTGMGDDGAEGLLRLRRAGSFTIGQDERSCVVYGMPKAAAELGALDLVESLEDIPRTLTRKAA